MNDLAGIFVSSFLIALSGAIVPGPVLSVTISESVKRNFWAGPMIVFGHGLLELLLIGLLVTGLANFINNRVLLSTVGILGGLYLLWMSFAMVRDVKHATMARTGEGKSWGGPVFAGIMTSLANPYWIIWWATIGLGYVIVSLGFGWIGVVVFFIGHILADLFWYSMVSFVVSKGKIFISDTLYRRVIAICALMLVFFGLVFSAWGIRELAHLI